MKMKQLLLAAANVLATVSLVVSDELDLTFYKLSLHWPPSACSFKGKQCVQNIPETFTIHGLWPQKNNDEPVPPYDKDSTCTTIVPTRADAIIVELNNIKEDLKRNWPNLYLKKGKHDDEGFWKHEWSKHGMCSDYPDDPRNYFNQALSLHRNYDPLKVIGIQPGDTPHQVSKILDNVKKALGYDPQIACNLNQKGNKRQPWEIRLCFHRKNPSLRDCPNRLDLKHNCTKETDQIILPPASPPPPPPRHLDL